MNRLQWPLDKKVYVGGLPPNTEKAELERAFGQFGRVLKVWISRQPPGFAFVLFERFTDADAAASALNGTSIRGATIRVAKAHGLYRNGVNHRAQEELPSEFDADASEQNETTRAGKRATAQASDEEAPSTSKKRARSPTISKRLEKIASTSSNNTSVGTKERSRSLPPNFVFEDYEPDEASAATMRD